MGMIFKGKKEEADDRSIFAKSFNDGEEFPYGSDYEGGIHPFRHWNEDEDDD